MDRNIAFLQVRVVFCGARTNSNYKLLMRCAIEQRTAETTLEKESGKAGLLLIVKSRLVPSRVGRRRRHMPQVSTLVSSSRHLSPGQYRSLIVFIL